MRLEQRESMLSDKNGQRSYLAKNLRNTFISIISPFKKKLDKLLLDKEERERIIENPNDILSFSAEIGKGKKRVQGYNVMKALTEAYYFISGFNYLITQGELSGAGILIEGADPEEELLEQQKEAAAAEENKNADMENAGNEIEGSTDKNNNAENNNIDISNSEFNESIEDKDLFGEEEEAEESETAVSEEISETESSPEAEEEKTDEEDIKQ